MVNLPRIISFWTKVLGYHLGLIFGSILFFAFITELITKPTLIMTLKFWLAVGINMLPAIVVVVAVLWLAGRFVQKVYGMSSKGEGIRFLMYNRFGKPGFTPFIKIDQGKIPPNAHKTLMQAGGRGSVIISNHSAAVLEQKGRLTRVEGPGYIVLEPFEKIYDTVDLRPKCWTYSVEAMSQEGIPITWDVEVRYQIARDKKQQTNFKTPYPVSKDTVFKAVTCKWKRQRPAGKDIMDWEKLIVISRTEGTLRSILARYPLDKLIGLSQVVSSQKIGDRSTEATSMPPEGARVRAQSVAQPKNIEKLRQAEEKVIRETIQEELKNVLPGEVAGLGAEIIDIKLGNLKVEDEVTQQLIKTWQVNWQQQSANQLASDQSDRVPAYEIFKTEAQMLPLKTLKRELYNLDSCQAITSIALTYFFSVLEERMRTEIRTSAEQDDNTSDSDWLNPPSLPTPPKPKPAPSTQPKPILKLFPIIDEIAAGKEIPVVNDLIGYIRQTGESEFELELEGQPPEPLNFELLGGRSQTKFGGKYNYVSMKVSGDSMDQRGISPGDYVILRESSNCNPGDIVAVVFHHEDNKATLKHLIRKSNQVILRSYSSNPEHKDRILRDDDLSKMRIAGIAIAVLKRMN